MPLSEHLETHLKMPKTALELIERYKNNPLVHIQVIDNSQGKPITVNDPIAFLKQKRYTIFDEQRIKQQAKTELENAFKTGAIQSRTYFGTKGGGIAADGARISGQLEPQRFGGYGDRIKNLENFKKKTSLSDKTGLLIHPLAPAGVKPTVAPREAEIKELTQRRERLQALRDFLGLSDDDIRKVSRKDIRFMQKEEFNNFLNDFEAKATQLVEDRQIKNEIVSQIQNKELKKVDNLRQFLELPKLEDMTPEQLRQFNDALIPFQRGDEFLSLRKLQTVDNTELIGIRTLREAKKRLAKKINVPLIELDNIKVSPLDRFRYDTALARRNEFYRLLVDETNQSMLTAEKRFLELKQDINEFNTSIKFLLL